MLGDRKQIGDNKKVIIKDAAFRDSEVISCRQGNEL